MTYYYATYMPSGMTLEQYLLDKKLTQKELARRLGVAQSTVSRLFDGSRRPSLNMALEIERVTGGAVPVTEWAARRRAV